MQIMGMAKKQKSAPLCVKNIWPHFFEQNVVELVCLCQKYFSKTASKWGMKKLAINEKGKIVEEIAK